MEWHHFNQTIYIHSPKETLYHCFATAKGMESWFLRSCVFTRNGLKITDHSAVQEGDEYTFLWHGWPDETMEKGKILQTRTNEMIEFTFDGNGATDMVVKVDLEETDHGTKVNLYQYNIPITEEGKASWHVGCKTGWNFYLTNLKAIAEYGVDLRNKNMDLKGVLNS